MLQNFLEWLRRLFDRTPRKTPEEQAEDLARKIAYQDTTEVNFIATASNKVANIVCEDATIEVIGTGPRAEYLTRCMERVKDRLKLMTARAFGTGGVWLVPYNVGTELHVDIIDQTEFFIIEQRGSIPISAQYVAGQELVEGVEFIRAVYCSLDEAGNYTIENRAMSKGEQVPLTVIPAWAEIPETITISGVDQMLLGYVMCPVDSRKDTNELRGVPITYGQEKLIAMILTILNQIPDEYRLKKAFVGVSSLLLNGSGKPPEDGMFVTFGETAQIGEKPFFEPYGPPIRHESYIEGLEYLLGMLEKQIGLNKGILTDLATADATATAIKRSTFDTFSIVDAMRSNLRAGIEQIMYAFDVMASSFGYAPQGAWELSFDWSYSLLEDSAETWSQYMDGLSAGIMKPEEARAWLLDVSEADALEGLPLLADETGRGGE